MRTLVSVVTILALLSSPLSAQEIDHKKLRQAIILPVIGLKHGFTIVPDCGSYLWNDRPDPKTEIARLEMELDGTAQDADRLTNIACHQWNTGNKELAQKTLQRALVIYDQHIKANPAKAWAWIGKGDMYFCRGKYDEAEHYYRLAVEVAGGDPKAWSALGQNHAFRARDVLFEGVHGWTNLSAVVNLLNSGKVSSAKIQKARHWIHEALACCDKALELSPKEADLYQFRASCRAMGDTIEPWFRQSLGLEVRVPPKLFSAEVVADIIQAAKLRPDDSLLTGAAAAAEALHLLEDRLVQSTFGDADTYNQLPAETRQRIAAAVEKLEKTTGDKDTRTARQATEFLGVLNLFVLGNVPKSQYYLYRTVELDPTRDNVWDMITGIAITTNHVEDAKRICEKRISVHPTAHAFFLLAKCHAELDNLERAEAAVREAVKLDPKHYHSAMALAVLLLKRADDKETQAAACAHYEAATKLLDKETISPETKAEVLVIYGAICANQGFADRARQALEQAVQLDDTDYNRSILKLLSQ